MKHKFRQLLPSPGFEIKNALIHSPRSVLGINMMSNKIASEKGNKTQDGIARKKGIRRTSTRTNLAKRNYKI